MHCCGSFDILVVLDHQEYVSSNKLLLTLVDLPQRTYEKSKKNRILTPVNRLIQLQIINTRSPIKKVSWKWWWKSGKIYPPLGLMWIPKTVHRIAQQQQAERNIVYQRTQSPGPLLDPRVPVNLVDSEVHQSFHLLEEHRLLNLQYLLWIHLFQQKNNNKDIREESLTWACERQNLPLAHKKLKNNRSQ